MAQALDPAAYVHEGFWTDWTKGNVGGLTLTLCPTSATFLTNSLALFVALSGGQLWTIIRFSLHQLQASKSTSGMLHNQQRIVLRNATTDIATARLMCIAAWRSRGGVERSSSRYAFIGLFALVHAILFMAAGTFSNKFIMSAGSTTAPSMVLSRSNRCGVWNQTYYDLAANGVDWDSDHDIALSVQYIAKKEANTQLSLEYAQECYTSQPSFYMSSTCNTLKVPSLSWNSRTRPCPFQEDLCHPQTDTIVLDTGFIDSHDDLGINARHQDRLTYRRLTTCAVLNDTGYVNGWDGSDGLQSPQTAFAYYGPSLDKGTNYTYSYSNFASFYTNFTSGSTIPYTVNGQLAYGVADPQWSYSYFTPIPEFQQTNSDLMLLFLSFSGTYSDKVEDPWFSAHRSNHFDTSYVNLQTRYTRDKAISALGCTEQHQFCTSNGTCTSFSGFDQVQNDQTFNTALTPRQNATFDRILRAVTASSIFHVVTDLALTNAPVLAANATAVGNSVVSLPLPKDQWKIELNYWHSIAMAQLQRTVVQWGTGQIAPDPPIDNGLYILPPQLEQDSWFCNNLMIPSTVYQSFSVISIILILITGMLVIILSLTIENLAGCIQRRSSKLALLKIWDADDMLRIQCSPIESKWKPQTPPKDFGYLPATQKREPIEMAELGVMPPFPRELKVNVVSTRDFRRPSSETLPPEHLTFPFPRNHVPPRESKPKAMPLERRHDSWVAISLDSFDAVIPEVQARNILDTGYTGIALKPKYATGPLHPGRNVADPPAFAIAGAGGNWI